MKNRKFKLIKLLLLCSFCIVILSNCNSDEYIHHEPSQSSKTFQKLTFKEFVNQNPKNIELFNSANKELNHHQNTKINTKSNNLNLIIDTTAIAAIYNENGFKSFTFPILSNKNKLIQNLVISHQINGSNELKLFLIQNGH